MRIALALSASIIALAAASTASAQATCENVVYGAVHSGYAFQDLGVLAEEGPVFQGGVSRTCGKITYDLFTSTALSADGPYGNRGGGDEFDVSATFNDSVESPLGTLEVEASVAYWFVADFATTTDDILGVYVQVGRPIEVTDTVTVTPYLRVSQWIGNTYPDTTLVRPGVAVSVSLSEQWSLAADVSHVGDSVDHLSIWRSDLGVTYDFGRGLSATGSVKMADGMPTVFGLGFAKTF